MKWSPLFLLCLFGIAAGSVRKLAGINGYISDHPDERCDKIGEFLLHPFNRCSYLVCDYGHEPWKDAYGKTKYYARIMKCAPGTAVPKSAYNEGTQKLNPHKVCTEHYSGPCPARVQSMGGNYFGGARFTPRHDSDSGYGSSFDSSPKFSISTVHQPSESSSYDSRSSSKPSSSSFSMVPYGSSSGSRFGLRRKSHGGSSFGGNSHRNFYRRNSRGPGGFTGSFPKRPFGPGGFIYPKSLKEESNVKSYEQINRYENEPTEFEKSRYRTHEPVYERPTYASPPKSSYRSRSSGPSYGPKRTSYHRPSYEERSRYKDHPTNAPNRKSRGYTPSFTSGPQSHRWNSHSPKRPSYQPQRSSYESGRPSSSSFERASSYDIPSDVSYPKPPSDIKYPGPPKKLDYPKAPEFSSNGYHPLMSRRSSSYDNNRHNNGFQGPRGYGLRSRRPERQTIYPRKAKISDIKFRPQENNKYPGQNGPFNRPNPSNRYRPQSQNQVSSPQQQNQFPPKRFSPLKQSNQYQPPTQQYPPKQNQFPQKQSQFNSPLPQNNFHPPRTNNYQPPPPPPHTKYPLPPHQNPQQYAPLPPNPHQNSQQNQYAPPQPPPPQHQQPQPYPQPQQPNQYPNQQQNNFQPPQPNQQPPNNNYPLAPQNNGPPPPPPQFPNQGQY